MNVPTVIAQRPVIADGKRLTVSTTRHSRSHYETVIFDDSVDRRHVGKSLGGYIIEGSSEFAADRDAAMENHREALIAARDETPK